MLHMNVFSYASRRLPFIRITDCLDCIVKECDKALTVIRPMRKGRMTREDGLTQELLFILNVQILYWFCRCIFSVFLQQQLM